MQPPDRIERNLSAAWANINHYVFAGALLVAPAIRVVDMGHTLADWSPGRRELRFSRSFVTSHSWGVVIEVLKHEMAHQYVTDVLGADCDETAHGPAFQMVCRRYGIDGRAAGIPRTAEQDRIIEKIQKLLNLGASANENESRSALNKAEQLMAEHGLSGNEVDDEATDVELGMAIVGPVVRRKTPESFRFVVVDILSRFFRVRPIWVGGCDEHGWGGLQLEVCGRRCDLLVAEHVHDFLLGEANRLWSARGATRHRDRDEFLYGVMRGYREAMIESQKAREADAAGISRSIVHQQRAEDLDDYFERRNPKMRTIRRPSRLLGSAFAEGVSAGRNITVHAPVGAGDGPKLLGS